jgi:hypothetical protein
VLPFAATALRLLETMGQSRSPESWQCSRIVGEPGAFNAFDLVLFKALIARGTSILSASSLSNIFQCLFVKRYKTSAKRLST